MINITKIIPQLDLKHISKWNFTRVIIIYTSAACDACDKYDLCRSKKHTNIWYSSNGIALDLFFFCNMILTGVTNANDLRLSCFFLQSKCSSAQSWKNSPLSPDVHKGKASFYLKDGEQGSKHIDPGWL